MKLRETYYGGTSWVDVRPSKKGNVILHPSGWVELAYFETLFFTDRGKRTSKEAWMKKYRPRCVLVRGTLTWRVPLGTGDR